MTQGKDWQGWVSEARKREEHLPACECCDDRIFPGEPKHTIERTEDCECECGDIHDRSIRILGCQGCWKAGCPVGYANSCRKGKVELFPDPGIDAVLRSLPRTIAPTLPGL